jgi:hypothetical protein
MSDQSWTGALKPKTDFLRRIARGIDAVPVPGLEDVPSAAIAIIAGVLDVGEALARRDIRRAFLEAAEGTAEVLVDVIPWWGFSRFFGYQPHEFMRGVAGTLFNAFWDACIGKANLKTGKDAGSDSDKGGPKQLPAP